VPNIGQKSIFPRLIEFDDILGSVMWTKYVSVGGLAAAGGYCQRNASAKTATVSYFFIPKN